MRAAACPTSNSNMPRHCTGELFASTPSAESTRCGGGSMPTARCVDTAKIPM